MKKIALYILIFTLFNCGQPKNREDLNDLAHTDTVQIETRNKNIKTLEEINQILYDNLVGVDHGPFPEKIDSGYVDIDIDGYIEGLRTQEIYSEKFFKLERERLEPCKKDLIELKYRGDPEPGNWENQVSCSFFHMYWLRSQESPTGYKVKSSTVDGDKAKSTMVFYDEYEGKKTYWDGHVYLEILYSKEQDDWRIIKILRLPED